MRARNYDKTFINDAVTLFERSNEPFTAIAERLGIPAATLRYWYYERVGHEKKKSKGRRAGERPIMVSNNESSAQKVARLERELAAARRQIAVLEEDREILKKAAAFFAKESE